MNVWETATSSQEGVCECEWSPSEQLPKTPVPSMFAFPPKYLANTRALACLLLAADHDPDLNNLGKALRRRLLQYKGKLHALIRSRGVPNQCKLKAGSLPPPLSAVLQSAILE